jgi:ABC-type uncharacterized transport system auxiliary subunit
MKKVVLVILIVALLSGCVEKSRNVTVSFDTNDSIKTKNFHIDNYGLDPLSGETREVKMNRDIENFVNTHNVTRIDKNYNPDGSLISTDIYYKD